MLKQVTRFFSFLRPDDTPLYVHTTIFFIHFSVNGCYFYLLAIVNNAAIDMSVQISLRDPASNSFGYYLEVELLYHVILFLII